MFDDIEIRYYRENDIFYSESREYVNSLYHVPKFITNILGVSGDFLSTDICFPYIEESDIFDYDELKKDKTFLKDKIIIVAVRKKKVVGICIFAFYEKFIYLKLFCVELIMRKSGFSGYFLEACIGLLKHNTNLPLLLVSTEEGHNFYKKINFKDIKYSEISHLDTIKKLKWTEKKDRKYIGRYLMIFNDEIKSLKSLRKIRKSVRKSI